MDVPPSSEPAENDVAGTLGALNGLLLSTQDYDEFLAEVAALAAGVVTPRASCGITTRYDGEPLTVATSDDLAARLDEVQYGAANGPCMEAMSTGEVVEVHDQSTDDRWTGYRERAITLGVRSSLSLPLLVGGRPIGALNLYGFDRADGFGPEERRRAETFAGQAATAVALARRHSTLSEATRQMEEALRSRSVIDQAIGVLMAAEHCDAATAFALLRQHSQNHNLKLRVVAAQVLERASGHRSTSPHPFTWRGPDDSPHT
jgi:GAF domain-containing protein